jgi:hypothetical protein
MLAASDYKLGVVATIFLMGWTLATAQEQLFGKLSVPFNDTLTFVC